MIIYLGRQLKKCEMCCKHEANHYYEHELHLKELYPKEFKTKLCICEKCAKRETPKKLWEDTRRNKSRNASSIAK